MRFSLPFTLFLCSLVAYAGGGGGSSIDNGGDTILCMPSRDNVFAGHYTLDFLLKYKEGEPLYSETPTLPKTVDRLKNYFTKTYPEILPLFNDFMESVRKESGANRKWVPSDTSLADVKDENIVNQIPANCLRDNNGLLVPNLYQTVIRRSSNDPFVYLYSNEILPMQEMQNPLQYSFFMVHEWLWDFSQDVEVVRKLNWLLHSKALENVSRESLVKLFENLGVFQVTLPICSRSQQIKSLFKDTCENLVLADLRKYENLEILHHPRTFLFRIGDFYGFSKVKTLKIRGAEVQKSLHPRIFQPLYSLKELDLASNDVIELSNEVTKDLGNLETLKLEENSSLKITPSFRSMVSLATLMVSAHEGLFANGKDVVNLPPSLKTFVLVSSDRDLIERISGQVRKLRPEIKIEFRKP